MTKRDASVGGAALSVTGAFHAYAARSRQMFFEASRVNSRKPLDRH